MCAFGGIGYTGTDVGAVMQDDQLLSGSIADNICFLDPSFDQERMIDCARLAAIHEEIMAMLMTYNTLIGDMGELAIGRTKATSNVSTSTLSTAANPLSGQGHGTFGH